MANKRRLLDNEIMVFGEGHVQKCDGASQNQYQTR